MPSARRFRLVQHAAAAPDERRTTLFWLASFLLVSTALAAVEIHSEALTIAALPHSAERAGATEPVFYAPSRSTAIATTIVDRDPDKD